MSRERTFAIILTGSGAIWAVILGSLLVSELTRPWSSYISESLKWHACFLPGWLVYFGWVYIAFGGSFRKMTMPFWLLSLIVNATMCSLFPALPGIHSVAATVVSIMVIIGHSKSAIASRADSA